jgi:hypothetical protein
MQRTSSQSHVQSERCCPETFLRITRCPPRSAVVPQLSHFDSVDPSALPVQIDSGLSNSPAVDENGVVMPDRVYQVDRAEMGQ